MDRRLLPFQGWRLTMFQAVMIGVFLIFTIRMYDLQILRYDAYQAAADENRLNELPLPAARGVIFDRNGLQLARNVPAFNVEIVPAGLPADDAQVLNIYNRLSALVDVPPTAAAAARASGIRQRSIEELVREGEGIAPFRPVVIAADVELEVALRLREEALDMPGVSVRAISVREYPTGAVTSHIVGYMGPIGAEEAEQLREQGYNPAFDRIGYDGLELFYEDILAGERGNILREIDVAGAQIGTSLRQIDPVPGQNLRLTIDTDLQRFAQQALIDEIQRHNTLQAESGLFQNQSQQGVVIAMDPRNGQVLSMVSYPGYDNTRFARNIDAAYYLEVFNDPLRPLLNNAIRSLYPPGSVWKLITASGALQEGVIAPEQNLFDPGSLVVENRYAPNDPAASQTFFCWFREGHQEVNMREGLAQSCNVYFYQIGGGNADVSPQSLRPGGLGITDLFRYSTAYGIGTELGIELPGENPGRMPEPDWKRRLYGENWSTGDTYNAALGQGYINITPLQLLSMAATVANGGTLYQPTLIESVLDAQGNVSRPFQPAIVRDLSIDRYGPSDIITLTQVEDMIMKGGSSLACTCEPDTDNEFYNPVRCNPAAYRNTVDVNPDPFVEDIRTYRINIPREYVFNGNICNPLRFNNTYEPAFVSQSNLSIVQQGARDVVTVGTGSRAALDDIGIAVAGKTGTAQYCDDIARPLGLCRFGAWPSHAWFVGWAPFENPEIVIIAFVYNGQEGSRVALPVVNATMREYFRLQQDRQGDRPTGSDLALPTDPGTGELIVPPPPTDGQAGG
ncbi:MAG TPA: penicillin-binding protein 2 [Aggregatilineales bacterium]|nr:penicillin-binding protein 2 [Aggregatilineales bacterium]